MIREDLLNKIKEIYDIKEFSYVGIERSYYYSTDDPFLLFTTDKNPMSIRKNYIRKGVYHLDIVKKNEKLGFQYLCDDKHCLLEIEGNETVLTKISAGDTVEYRFPGKAFNFDPQFVTAALEKAQKRVHRNGCC